MADNTLVAVDLAKTVFQVAFSNHPGQVSRNRRLSRTQFAKLLGQLPESTIAMLEAHRNEAIRPVPVETVAQQALCSLHRVRAS